ncbi:MAG TPA: GntR family transcriptional regulator, partial [Acidimicrobiia bacterium]|nr:GntR family transcriptional regulator [Acidimicrobiia bacterium]
MRYLELAEQLRVLVATGDLGPGGALPSEAEIGRAQGVSRVTVRRALDVLRDEGVVASRKGAGWFVAVDPVRQALGRFSTVEAALEAAGLDASRRILEFGFEPAGADVANLLDLADDDTVLRVRRVNEAAGEPFAAVTVWVPEEWGAHLSRADVER